MRWSIRLGSIFGIRIEMAPNRSLPCLTGTLMSALGRDGIA